MLNCVSFFVTVCVSREYVIAEQQWKQHQTHFNQSSVTPFTESLRDKTV